MRIRTKPSRNRTIAAIAVMTSLVLGLVVAYRSLRMPDVTIGVEGRKVVEIAGPQLSAVPFTHGDAVSLRIDSAHAVPGGFRYDLQYMMFGPGTHNLADHLLLPDGGKLAPRSELDVSVSALLPEDYSSELFATPNADINLHSNYTLLMRTLWGLWAAMLVPLAWYGHKRRRRRLPPVVAPTIAGQLRSLLERASREPLSVQEQVDLEQLLFAFWSKRLKLPPGRLIETIAELRNHPQAGVQLNRIERWFHSPHKPTNGTVARELLSDLDRLN